MAAYTSSHLELPRGDLYKQGDTLTLGDGTLWRYTNGGGWVPNDTVTFANDLNGGITLLGPGGQQIDVGGSPVSITGNFEVGQTLTAELAAGWTAGGYQWTRDGSNISGATGSTYLLQSADAGKAVTCKVSGLVYGPAGQIATGDATPPGEFVLSINRYRVTSLSSPIRCRVREAARNSIIIRNIDAANTVQIGFTQNQNSNRNSPSEWIDIPPDYEWYEAGSSNQVFLRAKIDAAQAVVEVETSVIL